MAPQPEQYLSLPEGRTLAYAHAGDPNGREIVLFFHGVFGVGAINILAPIVVERKAHYISPTLPGWGNSSVPSKSKPYHVSLCDDITALLTHLHPDTEGLRIYIGGGSFGTVIAQILFGASYELFPYGKYIVGMLLAAPFSPPHIHEGFTRGLTWANYFAVGPPSRFIPGHLIMRIGAVAMKSKVNTPEKAAGFIHEFAFKKMTRKEREAYEKWMERKGMKEGDMEKFMGMNTYTSVHKTWDGFIQVPDVIQGDWGGYDPTKLDEDRKKVFVLISVSKGDQDTRPMGEWLAETLPNARIRHEEGGHMSGLYVMDDILAELLTTI